ncbi:MAG: hypothetical protein Q6363_009100 [Candidatus Njordarchaeota archaeon]
MQNNDLRHVHRYAVGIKSDRIFIAFLASMGPTGGVRRVLVYEVVSQYIRPVRSFDVTRRDTPDRINSVGFVSVLMYIIISALCMGIAVSRILCFVLLIFGFICMLLFASFLKSFFLYQLSCPVGIAWDEVNEAFVVLFPDFLYYRLYIVGNKEEGIVDESIYRSTWRVLRFAMGISIVLLSLVLISLPLTYTMVFLSDNFPQIYADLEVFFVLLHFVFVAILMVDLPFLFLNSRVTSYECFGLRRHDIFIVQRGIFFNNILVSNFVTGGIRKIGKFFMWDISRTILIHKNHIIICGMKKVIMLNDHKESFRTRLGLLEYIVGIHTHKQKLVICTNKAIYIGNLHGSKIQKIYEWPKTDKRNPIIGTILRDSKIYGIYSDKSIKIAILA